jgi:DNA replication protein DnaC
MSVETTLEKLAEMKLDGMRKALVEQQGRPMYLSMTTEERLALLVEAEEMHRKSERIRKNIGRAALRFRPSADQVKFDPSRNVEPSFGRELFTCGFIRGAQNIIITGASGCGKTWMSCALGYEAIQLGFTVRYFVTHVLLEEIDALRGTKREAFLRRTLRGVDLLILDDFGLRKFPALGSTDLLYIIDDRIGNKATIVAGQMPVSLWHEFIGEPAVADAILDRIVNSSHHINLKGDSFRKKR